MFWLFVGTNQVGGGGGGGRRAGRRVWVSKSGPSRRDRRGTVGKYDCLPSLGVEVLVARRASPVMVELWMQSRLVKRS